ncbi:hypothetical protein [Mycobacterium paraterrae]|uniref:Uncharacterized protein n=1 Tax=Mycobacterium paraterrae TaxID=577492 RepID=A0ABY3VW37_9MYCO|nr:hypothetical protein [Mycobacterium paraterrae]UMB71767.1 hypothetical protein MKK62_11385 [Mycobacterium paraterrae]
MNLQTSTNNQAWQSAGYRPIPGWPTYILGIELDVWSLPREVPCKGGTTRWLSAKHLKPDRGRVSLSCDGSVRRYHVADELFPAVFPERLRPQVICRHGHPLHYVDPDCALLVARRLGEPSVSVWGTGNRICLRCTDAPTTYPTDNTYSLHHGVGMPDYPRRPLRSTMLNDGPRLRGGNRFLLAELDWGDHGYTISHSP